MFEHLETRLAIAREHQDALRKEADQQRLIREASSIARQEPRERFRVRDLRWSLLRPAGA